MGRLADLNRCEQEVTRYSMGSNGELIASRYSGSSAYPSAPAYDPEDVTLQEASPTAKHGGSKRQTLTPPIDYLVILTAHRQAPRGVFAPSTRGFAGRTAVTGFIDPYVSRQSKPNGKVSKNVRFIP